jgi:hypothetical protein
VTRSDRTPFSELGLGDDASADEVRAARRRLALAHHPDRGGDPAEMQRLNEAAASALRAIDRRATTGRGPESSRSGSEDVASERGGGSATDGWQWTRTTSDVPSFTVEALPVETFEALLLAAPALGEVLDDDPPYRLDAYVGAPFECWCRLDVVPDAGSSTVSLTIGSIDGRPVPPVETIRDLWIVELNALDW